MKPNYERKGEGTFAKAMWTVEDIHYAREERGYAKWDDEKVTLWLREHEGIIEDAMVDAGWFTINDAIYESGVKEIGSCNGHQETDEEYASRIAKLEGKPCNCGSEVKE